MAWRTAVREVAVEIRSIGEPEAMDLWRRELWPQRQDPIRALSSMTYPPGIDMTIYQKFSPRFFGAFVTAELVGVVSGHRSSCDHFRSRGLWVTPRLRGQGVAQQLLRAVEYQALAEGATFLWSYPRLSAMNVYLRAGFRSSQFMGHDTDHGYVFKNLAQSTVALGLNVLCSDVNFSHGSKPR